MIKFSRIFSIIASFIIISVFAARFYIEKPYYFSFSTTINSEYNFLRKISFLFLDMRLDNSTLEESQDLFQEVMFPSSLGLPKEWKLSNESISLFCMGINGTPPSQSIIFATALNASIVKQVDVLKLLNSMVDLNYLLSEYQNFGDEAFIDSLDTNVRRIIENREVSDLSCSKKQANLGS